MSKPKSVIHLADDLRKLFDERHMRATLEEIAENSLLRIKMISSFPVDTGKLRCSGFAYIAGKLVATTDDGSSTSPHPIVPPPSARDFGATRLLRKNIIKIVFFAAKKAGPDAKVFQVGTELGKFFDYAPLVLAGAAVVERAFDPRKMAETIQRSIVAKWVSEFHK